MTQVTSGKAIFCQYGFGEYFHLQGLLDTNTILRTRRKKFQGIEILSPKSGISCSVVR